MDDEMFAPTIGRIRIVNHNRATIEDRCDNIPYAFPYNVPVDLPLDAAHHLFGFHMEADEEEMKKHCCKRFGWNTPEIVAMKKDQEYFDNLEIRPVSYRLVEVDSAPYERKRRGKKDGDASKTATP